LPCERMIVSSHLVQRFYELCYHVSASIAQFLIR